MTRHVFRIHAMNRNLWLISAGIEIIRVAASNSKSPLLNGGGIGFSLILYSLPLGCEVKPYHWTNTPNPTDQQHLGCEPQFISLFLALYNYNLLNCTINCVIL